MAAEPHVLVAEFRTANEEQAVALFERLQALAEELGVELTHAPWINAGTYDAPELAGSLE